MCSVLTSLSLAVLRVIFGIIRRSWLYLELNKPYIGREFLDKVIVTYFKNAISHRKFAKP